MNNKTGNEERNFYTGVVYCYTNLINGKKYIGQTFNERERKQQHKNCKGTKNYFHNAIKKYGWDNFKYEVLHKRNYFSIEDATISLYLLEINYINKYNTTDRSIGYNQTCGGCIVLNDETKKRNSDNRKGANNTFYGKHHTEATKKRLSEIHKGKCYNIIPPNLGKTLSEEQKTKISNSLKGRKFSKETILKFKSVWTEERRKEMNLKMSGENNPMYGKHLSETAKETLSLKAKERFSNIEERNKIKEVQRKNMKPIIQYSLNGEIVKEWESAHEAARQLDIKQSGIQHCCKGDFNTYKGYVWKFANDSDRINGNNNPQLAAHYKSISRKVVQLSVNGDYINTFDSIKEAAKSIGGKLPSLITDCCRNGRHKTAYKYKWKYLEDYNGKKNS